jgi:hypothetical protein
MIPNTVFSFTSVLTFWAARTLCRVGEPKEKKGKERKTTGERGAGMIGSRVGM